MNFKPHSKEEWLALAARELSEGISLDDLIIKNDYFQHNGFPFPDQVYFNGRIVSDEWSITAEISEPDNKTLLNSLNNGAESIYFKLNNVVDYNLVFENIHFDYIKTVVAYESENQLKIFYDYLNQNYSNFNFRNSIFPILQPAEIPIDGSTAHIAASFKYIIAQIEKGQNSFLIQNNTGSDFYNEIARLRAMRIIFANISKACNVDASMKIYSRMDSLNGDFNQNLIKWTFMTISAILGGSDFISIKPWNTNNHNEARLAQNIQHLLKHESYLQYFKDPMAGSYFIENVTNQLVSKIWNIISE